MWIRAEMRTVRARSAAKQVKSNVSASATSLERSARDGKVKARELSSPGGGVGSAALHDLLVETVF